MSFEVVRPGRFCTAALEEGTASLRRTGEAAFRAADLRLIGVKSRVVVLADTGSLRVAVRAMREGEDEFSVAVRWDHKDESKRRTGIVNLSRAIAALNLTPDATAGRIELIVKDDQILILALAPGTPTKKSK